MAKSFKQIKTSSSRRGHYDVIRKEFNYACKYKDDWYYIEPLLWHEFRRREIGEKVLPDNQYNHERWKLYLDKGVIIGDFNEFTWGKKENTKLEVQRELESFVKESASKDALGLITPYSKKDMHLDLLSEEEFSALYDY